jgi:hypothetical protein
MAREGQGGEDGITQRVGSCDADLEPSLDQRDGQGHRALCHQQSGVEKQLIGGGINVGPRRAWTSSAWTSAHSDEAGH